MGMGVGDIWNKHECDDNEEFIAISENIFPNAQPILAFDVEWYSVIMQ